MDAPRADLNRDELENLGEQIAENASHVNAAMHRLLTDIRTFDHGGGWGYQGARSCAEWLSWRLEWDLSTARDHVRVARALATLPRIDDALRRSEISYSKVRAMVRIATPENEELLLVDAKHCTATQLEVIVRKYAAVRRGLSTPEDDQDRRRIVKRDLEDGMVSIQATLHPEEAELIWTALTRLAKECEPGQFSRVDALVELAEQVTRGTSPDRSPTELVVTVPVEALIDPDCTGAIATTQDGTCLTAHAARRLACDAGLVVMIQDADGNNLSVGRRTRTVPAPIKRAMLQRDKHCRFPGCCNKVYLDAHHAEEWELGGQTRLGNLLSLCKFHHRFVHEYGYRVGMSDPQEPRFYDPQDRLVPDTPPRLSGDGVGLPAIVSVNAPLAITATTGAPRWDGGKVNYEWVIDDLCRADRLDDASTDPQGSCSDDTAADGSSDGITGVSAET